MLRTWLARAGLLALFAVLGAVACGTQETADRSDPSSGSGSPPQTSQQPRQDTAGTATGDPASTLPAAVNPDGILEHARRFQAIADANGGNRAAGTPGYDASARYVAGELREAGYEVTVQGFDFPSSAAFRDADLATTSTAGSYELNEDFVLMEYSAGGEAEAPLVPVDAGSSAGGCESGDFAGFEEASVALLQRGTCSFEQKAANAEEAGAAAVVISNSGEGELLRGTLGGPGVGIPVVGTTSEVGAELLSAAQGGRTEVRVFAAGSSDNETTNVIAETPGGDADNTVMVGAHLDSVPQGPGINDNASGSATVLEIAQEMAKLDAEPRNRVRFAFWGAEELGLVGSERYVDGLAEEELDDISAYLNFDMVGSPNFARSAYEGPDEISDVFSAYFEERGVELEFSSALDGRSDHGPFQDEGIPTGGLFSGAGGAKTNDEAAAFGGDSNAPYDSCYHRACDDLGNLNRRALDQLSDGAAHATAVLAERPSE